MDDGWQTYQRVHERFKALRLNAHHFARERFLERFPNLVMENIHPGALNLWRQRWQDDLRHPLCQLWNWDTIVAERNANPAQFQAALYQSEGQGQTRRLVLHALAIGRTSHNRRAVRLEYLESYPFKGHPFKGSVLPIVDTCMVFYAFLIEARRIEIVDAHPDVVPWYERHGFTVANPTLAPYDLVKELEG